jgi:NitT/TauT family transport system permease protein
MIRERGLLFDASLETFGSVAAGLAVTLPLAILMGALMRWNRQVEEILMPLLITIKSLPAVALLPVLIVLLREPRDIRVVLTVSICFLPMTLAAYAGLRAAPQPLRHFALITASRPSQVFWQITFPAAASELLLGFRITLPLAFVGTLVAEMSAGQSGGLGNIIRTAATRATLDLPFAAIITVGILSTCSYIVLIMIIQRLYPASKEVWL